MVRWFVSIASRLHQQLSARDVALELIFARQILIRPFNFFESLFRGFVQRPSRVGEMGSSDDSALSMVLLFELPEE